MVQAKLRVGAAADTYELEADRVAAAVVARIAADGLPTGNSGSGVHAPGSGGSAAHASSCAADHAVGSGGHDHTPVVSGGAAPAIRRVSTGAVGEGGGIAAPEVEGAVRSASGGQPLEPQVRARMESAFGADFGGVRIHTGPSAEQLTSSMGARAFTYGSSIFMGGGQFDTTSRDGMQLLAHELTHVVQQGGTPTHVQRWIGPTFVGEFREQDGKFDKLMTSTDMDDVPGEMVDLAATIQQMSNAVGQGIDFDDASSFADAPGVEGTLGALSAVGGLKTMVGGFAEYAGGIDDIMRGKYGDGSSLDVNLGAQNIETGLTDVFGGTFDSFGGAVDIANAAGSELTVDFIGEFYQAAIKTKRAIEDSVAAEKLRGQSNKAKYEADGMLPPAVRLERFAAFLVDYEAYLAAKQARKHASWQDAVGAKATELKRKARFKSGDLERFEKTREGSGIPLKALLGPAAAVNPGRFVFLEYCRAHGIKEFGKGSEFRRSYEQRVAEGKQVGSADYTDARSLKKIAKFGQRRKAESATINSIEAAGHALDGAGTFTAGGDFGATKTSGKVLKAGAAAYKGVKSLVKRARRVHKLRLAKNEVSYGGEKERGIGWGLKQFFGGNVSGSQEKVVTAIKGGTETSYGIKRSKSGELKVKTTTKGVNLDGKSAKDKARLIKMLTIQAKRKVADLVRCLGSRNDAVFHRASAILHVIAETNLAGALARIKDEDLDKFRVLAQKVADGSATKADKTRYEQQKTTIESLFEKQLSGIGG
ncbi:MAG: DUF4157 domain-containing protein [Nitriliruptoraceae bacterium]|nr:DUF4157 domain-containing protein [Nitriliruptoraceae bacterium]